MTADALSFTSQGAIKAGGKAGSSVWAPKRTLQSSSGMASEAWGRATETELIREAQKGSRTAFEALVRQYDQAVLRLPPRLNRPGQGGQGILPGGLLYGY